MKRFPAALIVLGVLIPASAWCEPPALLATWYSHGAFSMCRPWGMSFDGAGNLYVADYCWSRVWVFTPDGVALRWWNTPTNCMGIATSESGRVYAAAPLWSASAADGVYVFGLDGALVARWDTNGIDAGQFYHPSGVAVDASGLVYVTEQGNVRVQVLTADGVPVTQWGSRGAGPGQFSDPEGIAIGPDGLVYVTDPDNQTIQVFTPSGGLVRQWGGVLGAEPGQFHGVRGITLDAAGNVYVADTGNCRIQVFTDTGTYLTSWGTRGSGPGEFDHPMSVAIGRDGRIYVSDAWNTRIQVFGSVPTPANSTTWGHLKTMYR